MDLQQEIQLSLTVLITGLVVVFVMLIFLTWVIKGYGNAVHAIQARLNEKQEGGRAVPEALPESASAAEGAPAGAAFGSEEIPGEVLAAISAAAYWVFPQGRVTSVRRAVSAGRTRSPWCMAGLLENTRPF